MLSLGLVSKGGGSMFILSNNADEEESIRSKEIGRLAKAMAKEYPEITESVINDRQLNFPIRELIIDDDITPSDQEEFLNQLAEYHLRENSEVFEELTGEY